MRRLLTGLHALRNALRPQARPPAANDARPFRPGDLTECIFKGQWKDVIESQYKSQGPRLGDRLIVESTGMLRFDTGSMHILYFRRWPEAGFDAKYFRKIEPQPDELRPAAGALLDFPASVRASSTAANRK